MSRDDCSRDTHVENTHTEDNIRDPHNLHNPHVEDALISRYRKLPDYKKERLLEYMEMLEQYRGR